MIVWFTVIALLGLRHIVHAPEVIQSINPVWAVRFFEHESMKAFLALGSIFLVVTGGEALYADMGHFGRKPITVGWYCLVLPALLLNYWGQGAFLLENPELVEQRFFFLMAPAALKLPLVILATMATIIASQALISGVFSLTQQAVQLDYLPMSELQRFGVKANELLRREAPWGYSDRFSALMQFQAERAHAAYDAALALLPPADRAAQRPGLMMANIYRTLLREIESQGFQVLHQRTSLTPLRKLWIATRTHLRGR